MVLDFASCCALFAGIFFLGREVLPRGDSPAASLKVHAWILTGANSLLTSIGSIPIVWSVSRRMYGSSSLEEAMNIFEFSVRDETWWTRTLVTLFASYCVMDMIVGTLFYRSLVHPATGYAHHTCYCILSLYALYLGVTPVLSLGFIQEIPVAVLAVGSIYPPWRRNRTFGVLYFILRLVYHTALSAFTLRLFESLWIVPTTAVLSLALHIHWWSGWMRSQISTAHVLHLKDKVTAKNN